MNNKRITDILFYIITSISIGALGAYVIMKIIIIPWLYSDIFVGQIKELYDDFGIITITMIAITIVMIALRKSKRKM